MSQAPNEVTSLAYACIIQRPDGVGFAATSHDQRHQRAGTVFDPVLDLRPQNVLLTDEMVGSSFTLQAGMADASTAPINILDEKWTGASVSLHAYDWVQNAGDLFICEGELGQRRAIGGNLEIRADVLPASLKDVPCVQTSPECRAVLGDRQCRMDMRTRTKRIQVSAVTREGVYIEGGDLEPFRLGRLRWISGAKCGTEHVILVVDGEYLALQDGAASGAAAGDRALIFEGCDGRRETCSERFGNILNFRAEPDLPGSNILLNFPGA